MHFVPEATNTPSLVYDENGYIIANYSETEQYKDIEKPNVHLTGRLIDTDNRHFTIEDAEGNVWNVGSYKLK